MINSSKNENAFQIFNIHIKILLSIIHWVLAVIFNFYKMENVIFHNLLREFNGQLVNRPCTEMGYLYSELCLKVTF